MKVFVKAKPLARQASVKKISDTEFEVAVKEPPQNGQANKAILKVIAQYFKVTRQNVKIILGHSAKQKIIKIFGI